ncbi:MAG TPA: hypothetical protein VMT53_22280 [Terriglobales bacterium]|nr:hypothetical protein [Terriglobales bacterium]
MKSFRGEVNRSAWPLVVAIALALIFGLASTVPLHAQNLGWEGETGVFVTPLAYTANVEKQKIHPVIGYHYLNAGSVIGDFHEASVTVGFLQRFEMGYTHEFHVQGRDPDLSPLWQSGFEIFHGKALLIPENFHQENWIPAVSVGFMARENVRNVGNLVFMPGGGISATDNGKANGDVYMAASKLLHTHPVPILITGGVRGTNSILWGMGGNAPDWKARGFGSVAFPIKLPGGRSIVFASEVAQQPHHPRNFPELNIPTTLTYAARFTPKEKYHINFDVGVAQIAGKVQPGVDLKARHQIGAQVSWAF